MNEVQILKYCSILENQGFRIADEYKNTLLPKYIYKYISLGDDEKINEMKLKTLEEQKIWCSSCMAYNDPFEFNLIYFNESEMLSEGYTIEQIGYVKEFYAQQKRILLASSFSKDYNSMPMWAHYANNHHGFCVKYKIQNLNGKNQGDKIFPVLYTNTRIEGHSLVNEWLNEFYKANKFDLPPTKRALEIISHMYLLFCAKHISWEYEQEYRILFSKEKADEIQGINIEYSSLGIMPVSIIAGCSCSERYISKLLEIVKNSSIKSLMKMSIINNASFELEPKEIWINNNVIN